MDTPWRLRKLPKREPGPEGGTHQAREPTVDATRDGGLAPTDVNILENQRRDNDHPDSNTRAALIGAAKINDAIFDAQYGITNPTHK